MRRRSYNFYKLNPHGIGAHDYDDSDADNKYSI